MNATRATLFATGFALLAALCLAAGPALGAEKKTSSDSKDAPQLDSKRKGSKVELRRGRDLGSTPSREQPGETGGLGAAGAGEPSGPASRAAERRAKRSKDLGGGGESQGANALLPGAGGDTPPKLPGRALDPGEAGSVASPTGDPLGKARGVAAPAPTAQELQNQGRAAKGDRTDQSSTVFRVRPEQEPLVSTTTNTGEKKWETAAETREREKKEQDYRPAEGPGMETPPRLTDEELARHRADTESGLVNPTEEGGRPELADPNRAREIGRSASPHAGWAIDPGSGETAAPAPSTDDGLERPDACDLAGAEPGGCDPSTGGLRP